MESIPGPEERATASVCASRPSLKLTAVTRSSKRRSNTTSLRLGPSQSQSPSNGIGQSLKLKRKFGLSLGLSLSLSLCCPSDDCGQLRQTIITSTKIENSLVRRPLHRHSCTIRCKQKLYTQGSDKGRGATLSARIAALLACRDSQPRKRGGIELRKGYRVHPRSRADDSRVLIAGEGSVRLGRLPTRHGGEAG